MHEKHQILLRRLAQAPPTDGDAIKQCSIALFEEILEHLKVPPKPDDENENPTDQGETP